MPKRKRYAVIECLQGDLGTPRSCLYLYVWLCAGACVCGGTCTYVCGGACAPVCGGGVSQVLPRLQFHQQVWYSVISIFLYCSFSRLSIFGSTGMCHHIQLTRVSVCVNVCVYVHHVWAGAQEGS